MYSAEEKKMLSLKNTINCEGDQNCIFCNQRNCCYTCNHHIPLVKRIIKASFKNLKKRTLESYKKHTKVIEQLYMCSINLASKNKEKCDFWEKLLDGIRQELTSCFVMEAKAEASIIVGVPWMTEKEVNQMLPSMESRHIVSTLVPYLKKEIGK